VSTPTAEGIYAALRQRGRATFVTEPASDKAVVSKLRHLARRDGFRISTRLLSPTREEVARYRAGDRPLPRLFKLMDSEGNLVTPDSPDQRSAEQEPTPITPDNAAGSVQITRTAMINIGGSEWKGGKHRRVYLNDWKKLIGLEAEYYRSGNVAAATLDGAAISNSEYRRLLGTVDCVYLDCVTGRLVIRQGWDRARSLSLDEIKARIETEIRERIAALPPEQREDPRVQGTEITAQNLVALGEVEVDGRVIVESWQEYIGLSQVRGEGGRRVYRYQDRSIDLNEAIRIARAVRGVWYDTREDRLVVAYGTGRPRTVSREDLRDNIKRGLAEAIADLAARQRETMTP
jgi:hypothetical protein